MATAYDGLRVLDCSSDIAGAMAAMYLGDQGADVVRIIGEGADPLDRDPGYLCWDRNKQLCALDTGAPDGRAQLRRLAATADVVVVDQSAAELDARGLDAARLRAEHPELVHVWLPMHGLGEPWGDLPADRLLADALSSASGEHGSYDGGAVALVTPLAQYAQGALGAAAAGAALWSRNRTGRGRQVVASGLHAAVAMQATILVDAPDMIRPAQHGGGNAPQFRLYLCADRTWLYIAAMTQAQFVTLLDAIDLLDVLVMPGVDGEMLNVLRPGVGEPVYERLRDRFLERPREEWISILTAAGVPNAPAQTRDEWWDSDVVGSSGMRHLVMHDELGEVELPGDPLRMSRTSGVFSHLPGSGAAVLAADVWTDGRRPLPAWVPVTAADEPDGAPLDGLRVLDLGSFIAGPLVASVLGDFGADVVKLEGREPDTFRPISLSYLVVHKGQRAIQLDVRDPTGRDAFDALIRSTDVVVDNLRPGARERIGTDYSTLAAINPRLVRGTLTAWGTDNSLSHTAAFDPLLQARSGLIVAQGGDDAPGTGSMMVHDVGTAMIMAFGVLAALYARDRDGAGQEVVSSMVNASLMQQSGEFVRYAKRPALLRGGRDWTGDAAAHRLYGCRNGWIALAATTPASRAGVGPALGLPGLDADQLADAPPTGELAQRIAAALAELPRQDALAALARAGVPAAPVLASGGFLTDPWLAANRMFVTIEHPDFGQCTVLRTYADWNGWENDRQSVAPPPGADTVEELVRVGVPADRVEALLACGSALRR